MKITFEAKNSGVNKSARERIGRQNLSQKVPFKKGSLGVIFSPRMCRENAHSKSANFERRHSGGHLLGRPLLFTSEKWPQKMLRVWIPEMALKSDFRPLKVLGEVGATFYTDHPAKSKTGREEGDGFKVPEGHHPRGTTLREALRGNLPLRGLCGGLSEGSAGSLRGFCGVLCGVLRGSAGFSEGFGSSDPMLVTLGNCWRRDRKCHKLS